MAEKSDWKKKWYWAVPGTILLTIISDNISEHTKNIPVLNYVVNSFKWLYIKAVAFSNMPIKLWVILIGAIALVYLRKIFKAFGDKDAKLPAFYNYTSDRFRNWTWKWRWENNGQGWEIIYLTPYWIKCDVELSKEGSLFSPESRCPSCQDIYGNYGRMPFESAGDIEKLIRAKANKKQESGR